MDVEKVTQADRERAVRIMADRWSKAHKAKVLAGEGDTWVPVQECARHRLAALEASGVRELVEALSEARLQLEYLDERHTTGTTPATIAKIDAAVSQYRGGSCGRPPISEQNTGG